MKINKKRTFVSARMRYFKKARYFSLSKCLGRSKLIACKNCDIEKSIEFLNIIIYDFAAKNISSGSANDITFHARVYHTHQFHIFAHFLFSSFSVLQMVNNT
jgi:hypothetical protein